MWRLQLRGLELRPAFWWCCCFQARAAAEAALHAAVDIRRQLDSSVRATVAALLRQPSIERLFQV